MRILLAEDEVEMSNALAAILKLNNYSVDVVPDGVAAYDYAIIGNYDVVILDIMMPKMDGICALKKIREKGIHTPVLMLTAKAQIEDRIVGLDAGADDYLTKPFAMGEFLARIRAMGRRKAEFMPDIITVGNIMLDCKKCELTCNNESIRLGNKEFQMLEMLMRNPKRLISSEEFMERIWGYDSESDISVVWVFVSNLRKKLSSLNANVKIKAVRKIGYGLEEQ